MLTYYYYDYERRLISTVIYLYSFFKVLNYTIGIDFHCDNIIDNF